MDPIAFSAVKLISKEVSAVTVLVAILKVLFVIVAPVGIVDPLLKSIVVAFKTNSCKSISSGCSTIIDVASFQSGNNKFSFIEKYISCSLKVTSFRTTNGKKNSSAPKKGSRPLISFSVNTPFSKV